MADGHLNKCKECTKTDVSAYRDEHPDIELETRLKACEKNPNQKNARMAIDAAIRSGRISKPSRCQGCGRSASETRLSAHHYDYTRPLDVIWVCAACHRPLDHVRAYVDSGKPWSEYKSTRQRTYYLVKRALQYYEKSDKVRKPFKTEEVLREVRI